MDETQIAVVADPIVTEQEKREALDALLAATATVNDERLIAASNMADGAELFSQMGRVVREFVDGETTKLREEFGTKGASGMRYLGIWHEGEYREGSAITFGGGIWVCEKATSARPGAPNSGWRLATKSGTPGPQGPEGPPGPKPSHRWEDTSLQFERPDGSWGDRVNLKGPPGETSFGGGTLHASLFTEPFSYMPSGW